MLLFFSCFLSLCRLHIFNAFIPPVRLGVCDVSLFKVQLLPIGVFPDFVRFVLECRTFRWLPNGLSCCIGELLRISVRQVLNYVGVPQLSRTCLLDVEWNAGVFVSLMMFYCCLFLYRGVFCLMLGVPRI